MSYNDKTRDFGHDMMLPVWLGCFGVKSIEECFTPPEYLLYRVKASAAIFIQLITQRGVNLYEANPTSLFSDVVQIIYGGRVTSVEQFRTVCGYGSTWYVLSLALALFKYHGILGFEAFDLIMPDRIPSHSEETIVFRICLSTFPKQRG